MRLIPIEGKRLERTMGGIKWSIKCFIKDKKGSITKMLYKIIDFCFYNRDLLSITDPIYREVIDNQTSAYKSY